MSHSVIDLDALASEHDDPIDTAFASELLDAVANSMREQFGDLTTKITASFSSLTGILAPTNAAMLETFESIVRSAIKASGSGQTLDEYLFKMNEEMVDSISAVRHSYESVFADIGTPWQESIQSAFRVLSTAEDRLAASSRVPPVERSAIHRAIHDHIAFALQPSDGPKRNRSALWARWRLLSAGDKIAVILMLQGFVMALMVSATLLLTMQQGRIVDQQLAVAIQQLAFEQQARAKDDQWRATVLDLQRDIDRRVRDLVSQSFRSRQLVRRQYPAYIQEKRPVMHP